MGTTYEKETVTLENSVTTPPPTSERKVPWWGRAQKFMDRPWYIGLVAMLAALDLFILVIPTDGLLVTAVLVKPKRWISRFLWVTTGSAMGAALLVMLVQWDSDWIMNSLFASAFQSETWQYTADFVERNGIWALSLVAVSIFPQQPGVVIAALAGMTAWQVFCTVWIGRAVKNLFFAYLASHAPHYLAKIPFIRDEIASVQKANEGK